MVIYDVPESSPAARPRPPVNLSALNPSRRLYQLLRISRLLLEFIDAPLSIRLQLRELNLHLSSNVLLQRHVCLFLGEASQLKAFLPSTRYRC